jgi:hypothetical protein
VEILLANADALDNVVHLLVETPGGNDSIASTPDPRGAGVWR